MTKIEQRFAVSLLVALMFQHTDRIALAHEGHAALPSTGATVDGDLLLLSPEAMEAIGLKTEVVTLGDLRQVLRVNAHVELPWTGEAVVTTLTPGRVERIYVQPGQTVEAGEELAEVASLELEALQATLLEAAASVDVLQRLVDQRQGLADEGVIAGKALLESQAELKQKLAQFDITRRKLLALGLGPQVLDEVLTTGKTVRTIPVTAPISGTVEHVDARPGQLLQPSDHLFRIVDARRLYVVGEVVEADAFLVQEGQNVAVSVSGCRVEESLECGPDQQFHGQVDHIRLRIDPVKRTLLAVATVDNQDGLLRPGMFGQMEIEVASASQEILCPTSAFIETQQDVFVLLREGKGKFRRQAVQIGMRSHELAVVKSGLFPGQRVVTEGTHLLAAMFERSEHAEEVATDQSPRRFEESETDRSLAPSPDRDVVLAAQARVELPPGQKALATSHLEGRVVRIDVQPGEVVQAGQVLAEIESQALRDMQLDLLQSRAKLQWIEQEVARLRPLVEAGLSPAHDFWQLELQQKNLTQHVDSLQRRMALVGVPEESIHRLGNGNKTPSPEEPPLIGRMAIYAPIAGQIADEGPVLGQIVHARDSLFEIQDLDQVWVKALLLERDTPRVRVGQEASTTFAANPNLRIVGRVVRVSPQLGSQERVLPVWIEVANPAGLLREGMFARVEIRDRSAPQPYAETR